MAGYDNDYVALVLKEITSGLLARPKRVNWDLVGDLATTLAAQNEKRQYGPRYGELPELLLNAFNTEKPEHLAATLSTSGWSCWQDVVTLANDAGAHVLDQSTTWKIDYAAIVRSLRWKKGMRDVVWHGHENRNYARCEFMWPSGYRTSGARAFNSTRTRSADLVVQWDAVLTPHLAELERAFDWHGFPFEVGRFDRYQREVFYDHTWSWDVPQGWLHAFDLYYFLPYICKGAALVMQAAKDAAELLEPSRGLVRRGEPVTMTQDRLTEWLEDRGWETLDTRETAPPPVTVGPGWRDISMHAVPYNHDYTLSIQAGPGLNSTPGDEPGTATRVEVAVWRGRFTASRGQFLVINGQVPSMTFYELEQLVHRLEQGDV